MATIAAIRDGLKARLDTISGLRAHDVWPGQINPPAAVVTRRQTRYDVTFDDADDSTFAVVVFVQFTSNRVAQDTLDPYVAPSGASSVVAAIHGDTTLGGVVDFCRVVSAEREQIMNYAGIDYLTVEFVIEVGD